DPWPRGDAAAARARRRATPLRRPGPALPGARDHPRARRSAARQAAVPAGATPRGAAGRPRSPDRDLARRRPTVALRSRGLALPQPPFTASVIPIPGAEARPARGDWATIRAEP